MDCVTPVIAKIAAYTVEPIGRELGYLCFIDGNFEKLEIQVGKLKDKRQSVQHRVNDARRKAEDIEPSVEKWLSDVDDIIGKYEEILVFNDGRHVGLCSNLVQRHKLSRQASKMADVVLEMKKEGENFVQVSHNLPGSSSLPKAGDFLDFESRKLTMKQIMDALVNDNVNRIGVYGMGGVGKTMLVKEILRKVMEKKSFDEVIISTISQTPDLKRIQGQLADILGLDFKQETIEGRALVLHKRLKMEKSILIVFDDVWEDIDWETIGIPSVGDHTGCKILFTSRDKHLLSNEMCINTNFEIQVLEKDESWNLFKTMIGEIVEDLKPIASQIVMECARLPIAITTVAKALRNKPFPIWNDALDELKIPTTVNIRGMDKKVYSSLKYSYDYLEGKEVKLVFLLCSMFPEDFDINVEDLLVYAMCMGFLHGVDTVAQGRCRITKWVDDLKSSSLLLQSESKINYVKMHDLVRDVAILIASENDQIRTLSYVKRRNEEWKEDQKLLGNHTAAYLDVGGNSHSPHKKLKLPKVQLLRLGGSGSDVHRLGETFLEETKELKCLELTNLEISLLQLSQYSFAVNIKLLHLLRCELGSIDEIGELKNLEILSFEGSNIDQIPKSMSHLKQLKVLNLSSCEFLKVIPPNILSRLTKLEELYLETFDGWEGEGSEVGKNANLSELTYLPHLYALNLSIQDEKIMPKNLFSRELNLEKFQITIGSTKKLRFRWYQNQFSRMLCLTMEFRCYMDDWIKILLRRSEILRLEGSIGTQILHSELDENDSSHLKHLELFNSLELQQFIHKQNKPLRKVLSNLECLDMNNLENLESIIHGYVRESPFNKLKTVTVRSCNKLETLFVNCILDDILNLEKIDITDCKKVEVIAVIESEEATNQIEFTHLTFLSLWKLPQLQKFCSKIEQLSNGGSFFSEQVSLPNLEKLRVVGAHNLKMIWEHNILIPNSFSKLKEVVIFSCNSLEKVFPSSILSMLTCLNSLRIKDCNLLEGVFEVGEKNVAFIQNLRVLRLTNLPNLEYVWSMDPLELLIFENIAELSIHECPKLKKALNQLDFLEIDFNELIRVIEKEKSVQMICKDDPGRSFSKLKYLTLFGSLEYNNNLTYQLPMEIVGILHNLTQFDVTSTFIEEIFPNDQNSRFMALRSLTLSQLPKLKHIWKENSSMSFRSLSHLEVDECHRLTHLLDPSMARALVQLQYLSLRRCKMMTTVIAQGAEEGNDEIIFNQLRVLSLEHFSELTSFYSGKCIIRFPCLEKVIVRDCPKMKTFSLGVVKTPHVLTGEIKPIENNLKLWFLEGGRSEEIIVQDINVSFQQIRVDNYGFKIRCLMAKENGFIFIRKRSDT